MFGEPGSGKSFMAVRRAIEVMVRSRRPVYTNLPLRWRVFRKYLEKRGGVELAGLVCPLSEQHFRRFIDRTEAMRAWKESAKVEHPEWKVTRLQHEWIQHAGSEVISGPDANWIPAGAVVAIDEAQHWFPNPQINKAQAKSEPASLMSYLTMHRHHLHWVWVLTQAERQISTTFRTLAVRLWDIRNRANDRIVWGIQFRHVGIKALGYRAFRPEDDPKRDRPHEEYCVFPWLPWYQVFFRLYDSFTHVGSRRQLRAGLRAARVAMGVTASGRTVTEMQAMEDKAVPKKQFFLWRWIKFWTRMAVYFAVLVSAVSIGAWAGRRQGGSEVIPAKMMEVVQQAAVKTEAARSARVLSMSPGRVGFAGGETVHIGGNRCGLQLVSVSSQSGTSVWSESGSGDVWVWRLGSSAERLGSSERVLRAAETVKRGGPASSQPAR